MQPPVEGTGSSDPVEEMQSQASTGSSSRGLPPRRKNPVEVMPKGAGASAQFVPPRPKNALEEMPSHGFHLLEEPWQPPSTSLMDPLVEPWQPPCSHPKVPGPRKATKLLSFLVQLFFRRKNY